MEADAPQGGARRAAKAVTHGESGFSRVDADLLVLKWMTGFIFAGVSALIVKSFFG